MQKTKLALNLLILITLIGLVIVGWTAGDAIRKSFQERQYLLESLSAEELGVFQTYTPQILVGVSITNGNITAGQGCKDNVYYTSLPAKCQSVEGRLIQVGDIESNIILVPPLDDPGE